MLIETVVSNEKGKRIGRVASPEKSGKLYNQSPKTIVEKRPFHSLDQPEEPIVRKL